MLARPGGFFRPAFCLYLAGLYNNAMQKPLMYLVVAVCLVIFLYMAKKRIDRRTAALTANAPTEGKSRTDVVRRIKEGEAFVLKLDELGYFKYTDSQHLSALQNYMAKNSDPATGFPGCFTDGDSTSYSVSFRCFGADNEDLFEEGGFTGLLRDMQPVFDKMGVAMKVTAHREVWDDKNHWLNHSISLNGRPYTIFKNFKGYGWGEAMAKFTQIVNTELEIQGSDERLYPWRAANDGLVALLTEQQLQYIHSKFPGKHDRPLPLREWCDLYQVTIPE